MKIEEAKERLSCYRPGVDDPADELFAPALSAAEHDPELAKWMQDQQEFDSELRDHLRNADLPPGLLEHLQSTAGKPAPGKVIPMNLWTRVAAVAAAIVIGLFGLNSLNSPASAVESFRGEMVKMATSGFSLDHKSGDIKSLRDRLASDEAPIYDDCRPCIGQLKGVGCRKFVWKDNTVSVLCFEKETGKVVHMFVIERAALAEDLASDKVPYKELGGLETGGWVDAKNVYLLVGADSDVVVSDLLLH